MSHSLIHSFTHSFIHVCIVNVDHPFLSPIPFASFWTEFNPVCIWENTHTHERRKACIIHRFIVANHGRSPQLQSLWNDNRWTMCQSDDGSCNGNNRRRPTMSNDCLLAETRTLAHFRSRPIVIASRINNCLKVFVCMYVYNGCVYVCVCVYVDIFVVVYQFKLFLCDCDCNLNKTKNLVLIWGCVVQFHGFLLYSTSCIFFYYYYISSCRYFLPMKPQLC